MPREYKYQRVAITRTEGEWKEIERRLSDQGSKSLKKYMVSRMRQLAKEYEECPYCITPAEGNEKTKQFCCPKEFYSVLAILAERMNRPISSIIDDFFIVPLLLPDLV